MKILYIEDDKQIQAFVKSALKREGFTIDTANDAKTGVQLAGESTYDIILLDIMMPGLDGYWALKTLRQAGHTEAIFMLTGQGAEEDRLIALEGGADDYLVKPFFISELVARIRGWIRRREQFSVDGSSKTTVGGLTLDLKRHRAVRGDRVIPLTPKEFSLLQFLMSPPGKLRTQASILQYVWDANFEGMSNTVEFHIKNLREKIDDGFPQKLIKTVRGSGYMIEDQP